MNNFKWCGLRVVTILKNLFLEETLPEMCNVEWCMGGLIHSQRVLLALVEAGMTREAAYTTVQRHAMRVWEAGRDFRSLLATDPEITGRLDTATLNRLFDLDYHFAHIETIFARVFEGG